MCVCVCVCVCVCELECVCEASLYSEDLHLFSVADGDPVGLGRRPLDL